MQAIPQTPVGCSLLNSIAARPVVAAKRRRGAPAGNCNALRHGRYGAAARNARAECRAAILREIAFGKEIFSTDKRNNSVSFHPEAPQRASGRRGAPVGNRTLSGTGIAAPRWKPSAQISARFIRNVEANLAWAKAVPAARRAGPRCPDEFLCPACFGRNAAGASGVAKAGRAGQRRGYPPRDSVEQLFRHPATHNIWYSGAGAGFYCPSTGQSKIATSSLQGTLVYYEVHAR